MPRDIDDEPRPKKRPRDDEDEPRPKKRRVEDDDEVPRAKKRPRDDDEVDDYDDAPPKKRKKVGGMAKLVPASNKPALFGYYCGIFSFIPVLCFILGPIAFILGVLGFLKAQKNPKVRGAGHAIAGIVCGLVTPPLWVILWYTVFEKLTQPTGG